ncbi:ROK family transcriptional regulator [Neomegalonema sp.]|uniref:ROK family transcriptional regulator n=1 Tax=Neomegalonema sp. TaxID=2039713 RepID=UPI002615A8FE|nr:ROK family transcriptional regulator [Neomegalonema sp.]MDD2867747.1 ROK family transcriptional regulator [Neomegalonema sp.]
MALRKVARPDDLRRQNRGLILAALRREGGLSRTELAARTRLSPASVSTISAALLAEGILEEAMQEETPGSTLKRGRPQVALRPDPRAGTAVVLSVTLNQILARRIDYAGGSVAEAARRFDSLAAPPGALLEATADAIRETLAQGPTPRAPIRISLGVQGVTDAAGTRMIWSPVTHERDIPFAARLEAEFAAPVFVANDCAAIVQGLRNREPKRHAGDFAAILLSHGVGMGLHLQGAPFLGARSSAMEFGHMVYQPEGALCRCGGRGCVEAYAGSYAILRRARGLPDQTPPESGEDHEAQAPLAALARAGPGPEREAFEAAGRAIGYGLRNLFTLLDPTPVALVGAGSLAFDLMEPEIRKALAGATGLAEAEDLEFSLHPDEFSLILEGGAAAALRALDEEAAAGARGGEA